MNSVLWTSRLLQLETTEETTQLHTRATFLENGGMTKVVEPRAQRAELRATENIPAQE